MKRVLLGLLLLILPAPVLAKEPLLLEEVLRSSAMHSPAIVEAMSEQRAAQGRELSAYGAFDTVFDVDMESRALGYYDGTTLDGGVTRPLAGNGGKVYGGYRVSRGDFPVYDGKRYTNELGEARVGTVFSLIRDRLTDSRRTKIGLAAQDVELARLDKELVAIGVQRQAIAAYQQWVAAGMRVDIYRNLLMLATERQASIERQIRLGARPDILGTENEQNILRRESLLVRAEQELAAAANSLSFYLRNEVGDPVVPSADRLPDELPDFDLPQVGPLMGPRLSESISRPELDAILVKLGQAEARRRLAENDLKPRLDLKAEVSKDFGPVGPGGSSRTPAEAYVGFSFSVPLQRRDARGRIAEAEAAAQVLEFRRKRIEDQILVEVNGLAIQVEAADKLVALADDETRLADTMAAAERRRFSLGASDFLVVNLREESAADARLRQIDAEYRRAAARAELIAATVDREQLGLWPEG